MSVVGWALAIGIPLLIVWGIVADTRAQAAHDRYMGSLRERGITGQEGTGQ